MLIHINFYDIILNNRFIVHSIINIQYVVRLQYSESVILMNRSKSKTILIVFAAAALALALGGATLLFFAMENDYDDLIRHFNFGSVFAFAACAVCVAGAVIAAVSYFMPIKNLSFNIGKKYTFGGIFTSTIAGGMFLTFAVHCIRGGVPVIKKGLFFGEIVLSILAAAYFFFKIIGYTEKHPALSLASLFPALASAFILLNIYYNLEDPLNSPLKIYEIVMLCTFMLFFTAEAGVGIGKPKMSRKYAFAGIALISSGGMVVFSRLAARIVDVDRFDFDLVTLVLYFAIWLYAVVSFTEKLILARENSEENAFFNTEEVEMATVSADKEAEDLTEDENDASVEDEAEKSDKTDSESSEEDEPDDEPEEGYIGIDHEDALDSPGEEIPEETPDDESLEFVRTDDDEKKS